MRSAALAETEKLVFADRIWSSETESGSVSSAAASDAASAVSVWAAAGSAAAVDGAADTGAYSACSRSTQTNSKRTVCFFMRLHILFIFIGIVQNPPFMLYYRPEYLDLDISA